MDDFQIVIGEDDIPYLPLGEYTLRLDLDEYDGEWKEKAIRESRETPEIVEEAKTQLREKIKNEPGLYVPIDEDSFLVKFLRPCRYYVDSAFRLLKNYYLFKVKHPKYSENLYPSNVRNVFDNDIFTFLPTRTPTGSRIMVGDLANWNPKEVPLQDLMRAVLLAIELGMIEPITQISGVHVIFDVQGLTLNHICQFTPNLARIMLEWVQECAPVRLKGIHVINQPFIFNMLWAIFKPFVGEKLKQRLFFHGNNRKALCEKLSSQCLPPYLGGIAQIPEFPGSLFSDMLCYAEKRFEPCNIYGYKKEKLKSED